MSQDGERGERERERGRERERERKIEDVCAQRLGDEKVQPTPVEHSQIADF